MKPSKQNAFTLVEVLISILLLAIVLTGGLALYLNATDLTALVSHKKMAIQIANDVLECCKNQPYDSINVTNCSPSLMIGGLTPTITGTVTEATNPTRKIIAVKVAWTDPGRATDLSQEINLVTQIGP